MPLGYCGSKYETQVELERATQQRSPRKVYQDPYCSEEHLGQQRILSLGGSKTQRDVIEVYNCRRFNYPNLPDGGHHSGCALVLKDFLYYVGGKSEVVGTLSSESSRLSSTDVWRLNLDGLPSDWQPIGSLNTGRRGLGATVYQGKLVVSGGVSLQHEALSSGETYISTRDLWYEFVALQQARYDHALVTCRDRLYAIGGFADQPVSSVERLKTGGDGWDYVAPMQTARSSFAAVCYNDCIYAIGGISAGGQVLNTVEKYNPETDEWSYVEPLRHKRFGCSACVLQERIYVVGGSHEKADKVKQIESYYIKMEGWTYFKEIYEPLSFHSLIAL